MQVARSRTRYRGRVPLGPDSWAPQPGSQTLFLTCPVFEVLYHGTRGPGKTDALLMDFAQHTGQGHGEAWRGILFRRTYKQLADIVAKSRKWFRRFFPGAKFNKADFTWTWPGGEMLLLRYALTESDYWNYHGHEYPWVGFEELTSWPTLHVYDVMKGVCRSSDPGVPRKYRATANPYGPGHSAVKMRFIDSGPPGKAIVDEHGNRRIHLFGHWSENRIMLAADPDYPNRLASDRNVNRRKAWLGGLWDIVAGGRFDHVWNPSVHVLRPFKIPSSWRIDRAFDWGKAKPFSVGWWAESDGTAAELHDGTVRHFPRGTLIRIGEWYGWDGSPNVGINGGAGLSERKLAEGILERERRLGIADRVKPGPADASIYDEVRPGVPSIASELESHGVKFVPADKRPGSRVQRWEAMERMFEAALQARPEAPGLYTFETCRDGFIRTVPVLPRDDLDPDDVDTEAEDHAADETAYRIYTPRRVARSSRMKI